MDPFLGVLFVVWFIKVLAEDSYSTAKGTSNPRLDRRRARQKSRSNNPIWQQFVGWLSDVAADAREEATRARQEKRERQAEERRRRDLEQRPRVDAEWTEEEPATGYNPDPADPSVVDMDTRLVEPEETEKPKEHKDLSADECGLSWCPIHGKTKTTTKPTTNVIPFPKNTSTEGTADMTTTEVSGLEQAISYARSIEALAAEHGTAGNEGYIGHLNASNVTGAALASAYAMQEAAANLAAAADTHATELEKGRVVQEAYDQNADAGDQQFSQGGR